MQITLLHSDVLQISTLFLHVIDIMFGYLEFY
jgi:hypothetical protein